MSDTTNMHRAAALIAAVELPPREAHDLIVDTLEADNPEQVEFDCNGGEYLVLTDDEADERAAEYIKDSLWAFNPSFLAEHSCAPAEAFEAIAANGKCEDNNDTIAQMVDDVDALISAAISADGRGHFLAGYDLNEIEEGDFFIYRTN